MRTMPITSAAITGSHRASAMRRNAVIVVTLPPLSMPSPVDQSPPGGAPGTTNASGAAASQDVPQVAGDVVGFNAKGIGDQQPPLLIDQETEGGVIDPVAHRRVLVLHLFHVNPIGVQHRRQVGGA